LSSNNCLVEALLVHKRIYLDQRKLPFDTPVTIYRDDYANNNESIHVTQDNLEVLAPKLGFRIIVWHWYGVKVSGEIARPSVQPFIPERGVNPFWKTIACAPRSGKPKYRPTCHVMEVVSCTDADKGHRGVEKKHVFLMELGTASHADMSEEWFGRMHGCKMNNQSMFCRHMSTIISQDLLLTLIMRRAPCTCGHWMDSNDLRHIQSVVLTNFIQVSYRISIV